MPDDRSMAPAPVPSGSTSGAVVAAPASNILPETPRNAPAPMNLPMAVPEGDLVPPSAANPTYEGMVPSTAAVPPSVTALSPAVSAGSVTPPAPKVVQPVVEALPTPSSAEADEGDDDVLELPELSSEATAFVTSKRYLDSNAALMRENQLSQDDVSFLQEMDQLVLGGSLPLDGYVLALRGEFPSMDAAHREQLIAKLFSERFIPWGDALVPNAQEVARKEKMVLPSVPYYMVYTKPLTYSGAAGEVARSVDLPMGGQMRERLRDLVMSRAKGIRVDAQVEEQMTRPAEFGGMGLEREKARMAILAMSDILSRAQVMTEEGYSAWLAEQARRTLTEQQAANAPAKPAGKDDEEDQKEIAAISAKMPKPVRDTSSVLALSTSTLISRLTIKPDGEYLIRRLETIVSTRLRDVRSKHDVLLTLSRDVKVGGLGLSRADAEKMSDEIEDGYNEFRAIIAQEEKDKLSNQTQDQTRKIEERKKREAEDHARWFQEKVKGQQMQKDSQQELIQRMRVVAQGLTSPMTPVAHPLDVKEKVKEEADLGELVVAPPATPPTAVAKPTMPPPSVISATPAPAAPAAVKPVAAPVMTPPVVKVSAVTAKAMEMSTPAMRPRMDDIRPMTARLSGPLAEIQNLNLASFRRMAKTPAESAQQILRKIDLLAQESFERRIEGVQAWQSSPLQQAYLTLVAEAFSKATPVNALATQKRAAGEDGLSPEELGAVIDLNGKLHF